MDLYLNRTQLIGTIITEPDIKQFEKSFFCTFQLETFEEWKKDGVKNRYGTKNKVNIADEKVYEEIKDKLKLGNKLYVEGKLQTRAYDGHNGKQFSTEVVVKAFNGKVQYAGTDDQYTGEKSTGSHGKTSSYKQEKASSNKFKDDDVPF
jgi:single-strand DNA-binding protein